MTVPLLILAVPAALLGLVVGLPPEGGWVHRFLKPVFFKLESEKFAWFGTGGLLMLISLALVVAGIYLAYLMYMRRRELPERMAVRVPWAYKASYNKFYMDEFYGAVVIGPVVAFSGWLWTFFDTKVIDGAVNGVAWLWGRLAAAIRPLQTGRVQNYAFGIVAGMLVLVVVIRWVWGA